MYARVVLGATKSVPFREVSSIQGCPYRGVPLYMHVHIMTSGHINCVESGGRGEHEEFCSSQPHTCMMVPVDTPLPFYIIS